MDLATTFRGLDPKESEAASRALERSSLRLRRLLDGPTKLLATVDGADPHYRVALSMGLRGEKINSQGRGHDLGNVVADACERLRVQLVKTRRRRESQRHRLVVR